MDTNTTTILQIIGSAVGGGGLLKIFEKLFSNNQVNELKKVIDSMREELDAAYERIEKLEKANETRVSIEQKNVILEVSMAHGKGCEYFDLCPIHKKYNELNK